MAHLLKPGQLCTIDGEVYRCSKRTTDPCLVCSYYYNGWLKTPCNNWTYGCVTCAMLFGEKNKEPSFPILVSMCKK